MENQSKDALAEIKELLATQTAKLDIRFADFEARQTVMD